MVVVVSPGITLSLLGVLVTFTTALRGPALRGSEVLETDLYHVPLA